MDNKKLRRTLQSAGMECFVNYLLIFNDRNISDAEVAKIIKNERNYTDLACKTRTRHSRMIIDAGKLQEALQVIASSKKVEFKATEKAKELLQLL